MTRHIRRLGVGVQSALLVLALGLHASSLRAQDDDPVHATLAVTPTSARVGDTITVSLTMTIGHTWYVYRTAGSGGQRPMTLTLTPSPGIEPVGDWVWPASMSVSEGKNVEIYTHVQLFSRKVRVTAARDTATLTAHILYQACNPQFCAPPTPLDVSTTLPITSSAPGSPTGQKQSQNALPGASPAISSGEARVQALVGHHVPAALAAPHWLNASSGTSQVALTAPATLVEFTWPGCLDCAKGYPTLRALASRYGPKGLRVVFMTYLFGSTPKLDVATVSQELAYDRDFWRVVEPLPFPIGVLDHPQTSQFPPLFQTYAVTGAPTYYLIDRHGIVRAAQLGHRDDLEGWLVQNMTPLLHDTTSAHSRSDS